MSWRATSPPFERREAVVDLLERHGAADQLVELELPGEIPLDVLRHVDAEPVRAHVGALELLLHEELEAVDLDALAERDHADHGGGAALAEHVERLLRGGREADRLERVVDAAAGELEHGADRIDRRRVDDVGRAERQREVALRRDAVDGDDAARADDRGGLDRVQPDAAAADHRDGLAGPDLRGVHHRADAGGHAAADERGLVERHVGPDLHEQVLVHEQLLGEARQVHELEHGLIAAPQPRRARRIGGQAHLVAEVRPAREAVAARAAEPADARDHVIAGLHVRDLRPDGLDDPGRLVPEDRGHGARVLALHEVEIGVAQTRRGRLHEDLVRADGADLHVVDDQLTRDVLEHGSFHRADTNEADPGAPPRRSSASAGTAAC